MAENASATTAPPAANLERGLVHRILRYAPSVLRDEWLNIGVLIFDPQTGERRLRVIEDEEEFRRVRRLLPRVDETLLQKLRDDLESKLEASLQGQNTPEELGKLLAKWDETFTNGVHFAEPKGTLATDLDAELELLYADRVAVPRVRGRIGVPGSRSSVRQYCSQVFRQAHLWNLLQKSVRVEEFTYPGDPMRLDYGYRRNGMRGFVHTLSVSRAPRDAKELAYTVKHIADKAAFATEFAAVTDVPLAADNPRHRFVRDTLRDVGVEAIPMEGLAVWVAKLRPMLQ